MILKDLYDLYELKRESNPEVMPERFWCFKSVSWELVLGLDGNPVSLVPLVGADGKPGRSLEVPNVQRTSGVRAFFLCDNTEYIFAMDEKKGAKKQKDFIRLHRAVLDNVGDDAAKAVLLFLDKLEQGVVSNTSVPVDEECKGFIVFRLAGDSGYVHERAAVRSAWRDYSESLLSENEEGTCLVTGKTARFTKLFPQVSGLPGAQSSGASLVSCNADAFSSYGQKISTAGPISAAAADGAGAALTYVLKDRGHRVRVGNDYIAFWTDAKDPAVDKELAFFLDPDAYAMGEDEETRGRVQTALTELRNGKPPVEIPSGVQYHLLGIAPYQARLAVRFYEVGSLGDLQSNVVQFLKDTEIEGSKPCSLRSYLEQVAVLGKSENVPVTLVTSCTRAMVRGLPLPTALMHGILCRTRVDHGTRTTWDMGRRAAILKACLLRAARAKGTDKSLEMERRLTVSLNQDNTNEGYLLGRLFALLEKAQQDAVSGAGATIRDRYMGAAATTPARVYPQLLKLAQHHIGKSEYGGYVDRRIQEVMGLLNGGFPKTLGYEDQGLFYIGYYQQRQALYTRRNDDASDDNKEE